MPEGLVPFSAASARWRGRTSRRRPSGRRATADRCHGDGPWKPCSGWARRARTTDGDARLADGAHGSRDAPTLPRRRPRPADVRGRPARAAPGYGGYGTYLGRIGVAATIRADARASRDRSPASARERADAGEALTRALPEPEAGFAAGILIGLRDRVDRDLAAEFTTAGVSHVVAISGWNIAIVAALVAGRSAAGWAGAVDPSPTIGAIVAYVAAGASASVVRAAVMAGASCSRGSRAGQARRPRSVGRSRSCSSSTRADRRPWIPAVGARNGRPDRLGDADHRAARRLGGGRLPGWLAESLGVSCRRGARHCRSSSLGSDGSRCSPPW